MADFNYNSWPPAKSGRKSLVGLRLGQRIIFLLAREKRVGAPLAAIRIRTELEAAESERAEEARR